MLALLQELEFKLHGPNPGGFCLCGCGEVSPIARENDRTRGWVRDQPIRFIQYHVLRSPELRAKTIERNRRGASAETRRKQSESMKGKLVQELHPAWKGEQAKQSAKHNWLQRHYPKSGICEDCGQRRLTHYSFLHHPGPYTRRREDYRERCVPCHIRADNALRRKLCTRRLVPAA